MTRLAAAALALGLAAPASAADPLLASATSGTIKKAAAMPPDRASEGGGTVEITGKDGKTRSYVLLSRARVMRDGRPAEFGADLIGDYVVRARYNPKTKKLTVLELESPKPKPAPAAAPATVQGEVATTDVLAGGLTVRLGGGATLSFKVVDATKIVRAAPGKPEEAALLESLKVGERVEVRSKDWKTADEIRVVGPAR